MRLLQVSLRSLLLYSLVVVLISIPVSLFSIREILNEEVDESLTLHTDQFLRHIKGFEYLDDLETDLTVLDQLTYDISIQPSEGKTVERSFETITLYDSLEQEMRPFRQLSSSMNIKNKSYILSIRMSLIDNDELVFAIGSVQAALIVLLAAGLLLLNRSLSRKLWKPFYKTLEQLKAYELDKSESIVAEKTNIVEFDDLNTTINHLTDRNRKIFLQQKEFIENASHELQTPLAIFQSKLDILMQSPSMNESDASTLSDLEETAQRMCRLNKNLLLLSKIDNEQFTDAQDIDLLTLINTLLANLKHVIEMDNVSIQTNLDPVSIKANKTLIEVLLTNLFHNAIRHSARQGVISIHLEGFTFLITNTGTQLKMDTEKMFDRFSKESMSENSTGLGLAIVKKICDSCSYKLEYSFHEGSHTFSVSF